MSSLRDIFGEMHGATITTSLAPSDEQALERQQACRNVALNALANLQVPAPSLAVDDYVSGSNYSASGFSENRLLRSVTRVATRLMLTFEPSVPSRAPQAYETALECHVDGRRLLLARLAGVKAELPSVLVRTHERFRVFPPAWETRALDETEVRALMGHEG